MFAERAKSLTDEDQAALQAVLSPSVRNALGKIIPEFKPVMDQFGSNEPNVVLPYLSYLTTQKEDMVEMTMKHLLLL